MNRQPVLYSGLNKSASQKGYTGMPVTESATNGFFTVDHHWTVLYWNKAAETLLKVAGKDIIGKNLWEHFAAVIPLNIYAVYHNAFLRDIPVHFEEYWAEVDACYDVITYYSDDTLSVSFKKISHQSQPGHSVPSQEQLKILNEFYRYVTEVTNDCLWEWNLRNQQIFWIDGSHKRVFGYAIENALIPQSFWESHIHPDDKQYLLAKFNDFINGAQGIEWEAEYRFQRAGGEYAYVCDRGHLMFDENECPVRMIGATVDITKRKITETQLIESEKKLSLIAKQTVNAVIITDREEKIIWVNPAFTKITEYEPEEVIGKKPRDFLQGQHTDPLTLKYLKQKMHNLQSFDCNILNYSKSMRPYWVHIQGQPLFDEQGRCERFFAIETDITEKMEAENKLSADRELQLQEIARAVLTAQENERSSIGREMHDNLNQVLGAAKLYVEMAKTNEPDRGACLDKASGYILQVIQEIRKISKTLVTPILVVGLVDSIKILVEDLQLINPVEIEFTKKGINEKELSEKLQFDLFRIIQEQFNNILKHAEATHATILLIQEENELNLQIADNGKGCDTKHESKGVGIANIRTRVKLLGGNLTILAKPNKGYVLKVVVPIPVLEI